MDQINYDGEIDIATGKWRQETHWRNRKMFWSELVKKLSHTQRTAETHDEYMQAPKKRQDNIKDIGGFVGGYIPGGRRLSKRILHRQLITLDIDFAKMDVWDDICTLYGNAAVVYSTHKHSAASPRLRLIMPLNREVKADEYQAIARAIAGVIDIEIFDPTTFQPERLMYWPSTSKDGEFLFHFNDGPWLDADEILGSYIDWTDSSEWPVSAKVDKIVRRGIDKQGDPCEKKGIIGAFCRTYTIDDAIEKFLTGIYEPCDNGRYTYLEGSTAAGLVTYDEKFAYSHHGTDPISGKLCNAFDLVRIHKFGLQDENCRDTTAVNALPSYKSMMDLAMADTDVRRLVGEERLEAAAEDFTHFNDPDDDEDEDGHGQDEKTGGDLDDGTDDDQDTGDKKKSKKDPSKAWLEKLKIDSHGKFLSTIGNVSRILENDPHLKNCFAFDVFSEKKVVLRDLPWRKLTPESKLFKDADQQNLHKYLEIKYDITNRQNIKDALDTYVDSRGFHPIRDYLDSLKWDGIKRIDTLLIDYLGAEDNEFNRAVTRKALVAAVTRIYRPGIKFDWILTTIGEEGLGKSTLYQHLGREWFSDSFSFNMLKNEIRAYEQIQGVWLIEIGEVSGLKKAESDEVKHFTAKRADVYRGAYAHNMIERKRQCIFLASTNKWDFLVGAHGNRRFWPVPIGLQMPTKNVFTDLTKEIVDSIWAEAKHLYQNKEKLHLDDKLEKVARAIQSEHNEHDERMGLIQQYLDTPLPKNWNDMDIYQKREFLWHSDELQEKGSIYRKKVCAYEIWCECLGGSERDLNRHNTKEIHDIMRQIGGWQEFKSRTTFPNYGNQKGYFRTGKEIEKLIKEKLKNEFSDN